jgi:hypothetical protein
MTLSIWTCSTGSEESDEAKIKKIKDQNEAISI